MLIQSDDRPPHLLVSVARRRVLLRPAPARRIRKKKSDGPADAAHTSTLELTDLRRWVHSQAAQTKILQGQIQLWKKLGARKETGDAL